MLFPRGSFVALLFRKRQGKLPPEEKTGAALFCAGLPGFADGKRHIPLLLLAPAVLGGRPLRCFSGKLFQRIFQVL